LGDDHLILKLDEGLLGRLEWNGGKPKGLGGVVVSYMFLRFEQGS
jgi:hypothetical protein